MHNPVRFHDINGKPYQLMADFALKIDQFNPQLSTKMAEPLIHWKKYDEKRQKSMQDELKRIQGAGKLSKDLYEIVSKGLA